MKNKTWIAIGVVLIVSLAGVYLAFSNQRELGKSVAGLEERIDKETQRLNARTSSVTYTGEPVGYVIKFENGAKFFISGDTAPSADMKLIISDYYQPDVAVLAAGGWFTMGPEEAAFATSLIRPKYVIPYHYASYPMLMTYFPTEFSEALKKYYLTTQPLILEVGKEKEVMGAKIIWLGHGSLFIISPEGKKILIDPANLTGIWPEKYQDFTQFGGVDLILLTHGHPDHVVVSTLDKLTEMYSPTVFAPYELGYWLTERVKVPESIFFLFNKGGSFSKESLAKIGMSQDKIGDIRISIISASHSSSMAPE